MLRAKLLSSTDTNGTLNLIPPANYASAGNGSPPNSKVNKQTQWSSRVQTLQQKYGSTPHNLVIRLLHVGDLAILLKNEVNSFLMESNPIVIYWAGFRFTKI